VTRDFTGEWLPGMVLLGLGAGTLFPNLSGAAVASAPGESFATATGMNAVARQVGAALGVALVIALIGTPTPLTALAAFQHAWTFGAICLFVAGAGCLLVGRVDPEKAPTLADAARAVLGQGHRDQATRRPSPRARRAIVVDPAEAVERRAESVADFLARAPIFVGLESEHRNQLAARARTDHLGAGQWLFHQGDAPDAMYVVRAGRLEVIDEATGTVIRQLGRGDAVGELALLTESQRSASVRAARATDVIAVDRDDFEVLLDSSPQLSRALNRSLGHQLREVHAAAPTTRPRPATVALVAFDDRVPLARLSAGLALALRKHVRVATLMGNEVAPPTGGGELATLFGPLLDRLEADRDLVLLNAGCVSADQDWTRFCLQQADRILVVTGGGPAPEVLGDDPHLRGCDLVGQDAAAGALGQWATALDPIEAHVLRGPSLNEDLARTARRLCGRSVGIVLSGGGARAFSHIGVLEELTEAGITIDRVTGVSMGAVIGALFAMGLDADRMDSICFEEWVQRRPLADYTLPRHSLIRGERFRAMLHRTFGEHLIEELPRSFVSGCTELRSGRLVLARHGPLWEAVGFSICLPVIAPPQVRGREIFIDGSLVDNLPVRTMADMGEGPVIAVDVKASFEPPRSDGAAAGPGVDGKRPARPPSLGETLTRVLLLGSQNTSEAASRHADLVIKPQTAGIGLLEFHQLDAAREAGRAAARQALEGAPAAVLSG